MKIRILALFGVPFLGYVLATPVQANEAAGCSEALVLATYNRVQFDHEDWRVAQYVTEDEYNSIAHDAGASAVIYGVPIGANYSDFQKRISDRTDSYKESLTHDQATTIMWTGLDPNAANAYSECLKARVFNQPGFHIAVKAATRTQVSVVVGWTPTGPEARNATPEWSWEGAKFASLPKTVPSGTHIVILPRPDSQEMLAVNFGGHADSLVIDPLPKPPIDAGIHYEETTEDYRSPEISGWGDRWSSPFALCTTEKPAGWTIVRFYDFHLESTTERGTCGYYTTCTGAEGDTATHMCRVIAVQGHNENRFDGYGKAIAVFQIVWRHPVRNIVAASAE
jgi:hypothetical protein